MVREGDTLAIAVPGEGREVLQAVGTTAELRFRLVAGNPQPVLAGIDLGDLTEQVPVGPGRRGPGRRAGRGRRPGARRAGGDR